MHLRQSSRHTIITLQCQAASSFFGCALTLNPWQEPKAKAQPAMPDNLKTEVEAEEAAAQLLREEQEAAESAQQAQQRAAAAKRDKKARQKQRKQVSSYHTCRGKCGCDWAAVPALVASSMNGTDGVKCGNPFCSTAHSPVPNSAGVGF